MDPYRPLADVFLGHYETIRGAVRYHLAAEQVDAHIAPPPATVVDVGGGAGQQAVRLARRGYDVVLVDPSEEMLARAESGLSAAGPTVRNRLRLVLSSGEGSPEALGGATFDAVLCHGVFMYLADPEPTAGALVRLAAPGGLISVIAKNASALAMRPGLEQRWPDVAKAIGTTADVGGVGIPTRGDRLEDLVEFFERHGCELAGWYGIRVFTDHLGRQPPGPDIGEVVAAERLAGSLDPYRSVARLIHVLLRRTR